MALRSELKTWPAGSDDCASAPAWRVGWGGVVERQVQKVLSEGKIASSGETKQEAGRQVAFSPEGLVVVG